MDEQQPGSIDPNALFTGMVIALILMGAYFLYQYQRYRRSAQAEVGRDEIRQILQLHFAYFRDLSAPEQEKFIRRVAQFISMKTFIPRMFKVVTSEMKVLISAAAIQLTFGLPEICLQHFRRIIIYPDAYYSTVTKKMHKGEVNPGAGAIVLSWKSFLSGYTHPDDSYNLGLHEMAHALELENLIENDEYDFFPKEVWTDFQREARQISPHIKSGAHEFFRTYAAANEKEFFAVAVENFFERAKAFQQRFPGLYSILVLLLNQDPAKKIASHTD